MADEEEHFRQIVLDLGGVLELMGRQLALDAGDRQWSDCGPGEQVMWRNHALHILTPALPLITAQVAAELKRILQLRGWQAPANEQAGLLPEKILDQVKCPDCNGERGVHAHTCPWRPPGVVS